MLGLDMFWYAITAPVPLAGMPLPDDSTDWKGLSARGFEWVVALETHSLYQPDPLRRKPVQLQDLAGNGVPSDPVREAQLVKEAASFVLDRLEAGEGVVVHCWGGTGRTGTVIGRVMVELGCNADEVARWLDTLHRARGRWRHWPESPWQRTMLTE